MCAVIVSAMCNWLKLDSDCVNYTHLSELVLYLLWLYTIEWMCVVVVLVKHNWLNAGSDCFSYEQPSECVQWLLKLYTHMGERVQ